MPVLVVIVLRRYLCQCCKATMTVGPLGLLTRRLFSAAALGLALGLWGMLKETARRVHQQVNPWPAAAEVKDKGWRQPGRWVQAVREGRLFKGLCPGAFPQGARAGAERVAAALAARCPPVLGNQSRPLQVFVGAALAA